MAKIEVTPVSSGYNIAALNATLQAIEDEFKNKVLYRNEEGSMQRPLDMNGNRVINLPDPVNEGDAVSFKWVRDSSALTLTGLEYKGLWSPGVAYLRNNYVTVSGSVYIALESHTSTSSFITDLAGAKWVVFSAGGGDLLSTNNLSDITNTATARINLNVPNRTGEGASGNWNINALTSDTAGSAITAINAANAFLFDGISSDLFARKTNSTGSLVLPTGTTAQRDSSPLVGYLRLNVTTNLVEIYNGSSWVNFGTDQSFLVPTGEVAVFARNTAPSGWLKANGALVSRTTYSSLFSVIGTTFGVGDGSTTFGLPDLRGEFIRGWDDGRGVDSGRVFGSVQADAMQGHTHLRRIDGLQEMSYAVSAGGHQDAAGGSSRQLSAQTNTGSPAGDGTNGTPRTSSETRPKNVALLACIKF